MSLCLIVKNEAGNLERCLRSVGDLASETVVVDTGSTDETRRIAAAFGARVLSFDFGVVDFAAARNYAIQQAGGRWVLMLDADEELHVADRPLLASLVAQDVDSGYFLKRENAWAGADSPTVDYVVRLFPNRPEYRYKGRVHETIDASILRSGSKLQETAIRLLHRFSEDKDTRHRKNRWYIQILKEEIAADPSDDSRWDFLAAEYHQLEMYDEATAVAEEIARRRPTEARAHLFAGVYHLLYKPDLIRARADFAMALKLRPGYPEAESFMRTLEERVNR